ncbi:MAG: class I SAM-dependent methyltransferase [Ferruginibacter sp.]
MKEDKYYDKEFYTELQDGSYLSAKKILPIVNEIFSPKSVVDIGCGVGFWLKVWKNDLNVNDVLGVEGAYVSEEIFQMGKQYLKNADLKLPLDLNRKYDLVMSMEVAEHIPEECADVFVENLVKLGDVVMFSAAIKGQLGTYHINEQMPEYWAKKFVNKGYLPVDYIRPIIWNDNNIQYWYRQNVLLFVKENRLAEYPVLKSAAENTNPNFLLRIHPDKYFAYVDEANELQSLSGFLSNQIKKLKKRLKGKKHENS